MRVCLIQESPLHNSPTFVAALAAKLPAEVTVVHGFVPHLGERPVLSQALPARALRAAQRRMAGRTWDWELTQAYLAAFRRCRPEVVLAQFGPTAVRALPACELAGLPIVPHFRGYDAHAYDVVREHLAGYHRLFAVSPAIIVVSHHMADALAELGAPPEKIHVIPSGADCTKFHDANPAAAPPVFVAVGQFHERKAPQRTIESFAQVLQACPEARLRMVGDGHLLAACRELAASLRLGSAIEFLGKQPHSTVQAEMAAARCFVQHSVTAESGDREGTPVAVMEASAAGLPVVSTRHAGIPDVVIEGETGFLVAEHDVPGMADRMLRLANDAELAGRLGLRGREFIVAQFSVDQSVRRIAQTLESCLTGAKSPAAPLASQAAH